MALWLLVGYHTGVKLHVHQPTSEHRNL